MQQILVFIKLIMKDFIRGAIEFMKTILFIILISGIIGVAFIAYLKLVLLICTHPVAWITAILLFVAIVAFIAHQISSGYFVEKWKEANK